MINSKLVRIKVATKVQPGYLYLVCAVGTKRFKIGRTLNIQSRIKKLQTGCPFRLRYVYHAYVGNVNLCEIELHKKFDHLREIGEWFTFELSDVKECILLMRLVQESEPEEFTKGIKSNKTLSQASHDLESLLVEVITENSGTPIFSDFNLEQDKKLELAKLVIQQNLGQIKTIWLLWGIRPGGRNHTLYTEARAMLERLIKGDNNYGDN
jgi:hypothetical protein